MSVIFQKYTLFEMFFFLKLRPQSGLYGYKNNSETQAAQGSLPKRSLFDFSSDSHL